MLCDDRQDGLRRFPNDIAVDIEIHMNQVVSQINSAQGEGGNSIKLFTIAFGDGANKDVLKQIAEPTGGKEYDSSPENIQKIYDDIATFF